MDNGGGNTFSVLQQNASDNLFKLQKASGQLSKLTRQIGTSRDNDKLRQSIDHCVNDGTQLCRELRQDIISLESAADSNDPQQRLGQQKMARQLQTLVADFSLAQREALDKERSSPLESYKDNPGAEGAAATWQYRDEESSGGDDNSHNLQTSSQVQMELADQGQVNFHDEIIAERDREIQNIEIGVSELNEIFRDLGTMVSEQGLLVDNIETNISNVAMNTQDASTQLTKASRHQKGARNRACCLLIILAIVLAVILLAVLS